MKLAININIDIIEQTIMSRFETRKYIKHES